MKVKITDLIGSHLKDKLVQRYLKNPSHNIWMSKWFNDNTAEGLDSMFAKQVTQ